MSPFRHIKKFFGIYPKFTFFSSDDLLIKGRRSSWDNAVVRMNVLNEDFDTLEQYYSYSPLAQKDWFDKDGKSVGGDFSYKLYRIYSNEVERREAERRARSFFQAEALHSKRPMRLCDRCSGSGHIKVEVQYPMNVLYEPTACPDCDGEGKVEPKNPAAAETAILENA